MLIRIVLVGLVLSAPADRALAQNDRILVMRAALGFVKDSLPVGNLVFDAATPMIRLATDDEIARQLGGQRGRAEDVVQCQTIETQRQRYCTTKPNTVLVGFDDAVFRGDSAVVNVSWRYQGRPGRVALRTLGLELVRTSASTWRVTRVVSRGMS